MKLHLYIFAGILLLTGPVMPGQTPFFVRYKTGGDFPDAAIETMYEARNGALWFGAREGLFQFDGLAFHPFLKNDNSSNHVRAIFQDDSLTLWVGYQDGSIYRLLDNRFEPWKPQEGTPAVPVTGITSDGHGRIWFATYGEGVYYLDNGRLYNIGQDDGLPGTDIYTMITASDGQIWLGTDYGISICSISKGQKKIRSLSRQDGLPDEIVTALQPAADGNIWVGTHDGGVCYFDFKTGAFYTPRPGWKAGPVSCLAVFEKRELWIGTENAGLWRFGLNDNNVARLNDWGSSKIHCLHKDVEGNIWAISNDRGVNRANRRFELLTSGLPDVQALWSSQNGTIWAGTSKGLFACRPSADGHWTTQQHLAGLGLNVLSLYEDSLGHLFIGTFGQGLYCYHPGSGRLRHFTEKNGLTNDNILAISGSNGRIWLATLGGVTELQIPSGSIFDSPFSIRNFNQESGLGTNFIYTVFVDRKKRTWFGTDGKGLSVLENGLIHNFASIKIGGENIPLKAVYSITEDARGHIWFSTAKQGVFEFDGEKFSRLSLKQGIRDVAIHALISDELGKILILYSNGIGLLTPETQHLTYYGEEAGIREIRTGAGAACTSTDGNIWVAADDGFIRYTPLLEETAIHPRTLLTGVSIFLEPVAFRQNNVFAHDQNNLVFDYMGVWYSHPASVKYRYRVEGYDLDWIESRDRRATYSNLPPGHYVFKVTSTENEAWSDEPVVSWQFTILRPLWQRWWFVLICLGAGWAAFYFYLKTRDRRREQVHLLEKEKVESELAAIKAQINPHFLFNSLNTLISVIEENPPAAVSYVEKLSDFYRTVLQLRNKELIPLDEEIHLVQHFGDLLQRRYGPNFQLDLQVNGHTGLVAPLVLQVLVENAVKHNIISKTKQLKVEIRADEDYVFVTNNLQRKSAPEQSTRFGLQSIVRRYELLTDRKVMIESTSAYFKVGLPLI